MANRRRKKSNAWLYILIILCVASSAVAVWGISSRLQRYEESADAYQELQNEVAAQSELILAGEMVSRPEDEIVSQGLEEQDTDQDDTMWFIGMDMAQATDSAQGLAAPISPFESDTGVTMGGEQAAAISGLPAASQPQGTSQGESPQGSSPEQATPPAGEGATGSASTGEISSGDNQNSPATAQASATQAPAVPTATPVPTPSPTPVNILEFAKAVGNRAAGVTTDVETMPVHTEEPAWQRYVEMDEVRYSVNFSYLESLNPDVVAWLLQEGTEINYPVMQADNNDYYLNRLFNGQKNEDGSVFMDMGNSTFFVDANTYIYAHNTKVGTMFGSLGNYRQQAYYENHPSMILLTPYSDFMIDFFACTMSLVEDETSWRVKQFKRKVDFDNYITWLKSQSFFKTDVTPEWGDQLLVLVTCTNVRHGERYVVYGRMRPISYSTDETLTLTKADMDNRATYSGKRQVGTLGEMQVYVQNDSLWGNLRFEGRDSKKKRSFADGGAGPTAVATAIANMVPKEALPTMKGFSNAAAGYTFCTCSVNQYFCNRLHAQYQIQTADEFERYLPMALASFTTGNNIWNDQARTSQNGGTSMRFIEYISGMYGLSLFASPESYQAMYALERGAMVVCSVASGRNPFTKGSHYVVLAGVDDTYLYILDPYMTDRYAADRSNLLEVLAPNVVRIPREYIDYLGGNAFYILQQMEE